MNVTRFFGSLSFCVSYGSKSGNIVKIVRCSDVSFDCMLGWVVVLNGDGCGLLLKSCNVRHYDGVNIVTVGATRVHNLRIRKNCIINY